ACRPLIAVNGLSTAFVDPALAYLERQGAEVRFGTRLQSVTLGSKRVESLEFSDGPLALSAEDRVVLALPPWVASD
ncbi:hypothetical protein, partial [Serratia marcescens]|uniref:hypothetical protein n=1 Tax=Serratia marcescens TaxID=615 RepID=UPI001954637D